MKTLSETLGETSHLSTVVRKFRKLGFPDLSALKQLAVQRGCLHYQNGSPLVNDPGLNIISNEQLVIGLLIGEFEYDPMAIRISGQLLSECKDISILSQLAKRERVEGRLRYIAEKGIEIEPTQDFWHKLVKELSPKTYPQGLMPHADRFTTEVPRKKMDFQRQRKWLRV